MKCIRPIILCLLLTFFLLSSSDLFARGGGGGRGGGGFSGGGGGGYYHGHYYGYGGRYHSHPYDPIANTIIFIGTAIFLGVSFFGVTFLVMVRNRSAKRALVKAASADSFWNESKMVEYGKEIFYLVQDAWSKNELSSIYHLVTNDFYIQNQHFLSRYTKSCLKNIIKDIHLEQSKIVKIIDKKDDRQDTFMMYFKGSLIDYLVSTKSGIIIEGDKNTPEPFDDIYVFYRRNDKWLLNQIINDPGSNYMKKVKENLGQ